MGVPKLEAQFILKKLDDIPSLPSIVYELSRIINDPMSSTKEVETVMAQDIGMTAKVLKLANSAYYAIPGGVSSLARAIQFIGFDTVHQLVLSASIIQALDVKGPSKFDINEFWKHSIGVAIASEVIAKHINHPSPSDLFTCGLVHDIGKIALFIVSPETLMYLVEECEMAKSTFLECEQKSGTVTHIELGLMLGEKWQLPKNIQVASRFHHEKELSRRGPLSSELHQVVDVVLLANLLIHALKFGKSGHSKILGAPNDVLDRLMINTKADLPGVIKKIKTSLDAASEFIKMIGSSS